MTPDIPINEDFRVTLKDSREEALNSGCDYISSDHLLLGLLHGDNNRARGILAEFVNDIDGFTETLGASLRKPDIDAPLEIGNVPLTLEAEGVVKGSISEGKTLGADGIGTEHLLLSMLNNTESNAFKTLQPYNISYNKVLDALK